MKHLKAVINLLAGNIRKDEIHGTHEFNIKVRCRQIYSGISWGRLWWFRPWGHVCELLESHQWGQHRHVCFFCTYQNYENKNQTVLYFERNNKIKEKKNYVLRNPNSSFLVRATKGFPLLEWFCICSTNFLQNAFLVSFDFFCAFVWLI